jgi:hypothetical protein
MGVSKIIGALLFFIDLQNVEKLTHLGEKVAFGNLFCTYTCICQDFFVTLQPILPCVRDARTRGKLKN